MYHFEEITEVLYENHRNIISKQAYLVRRKTNEKILITRNKFKIGKEKLFVNYCIDDNRTISRTHADIVNQGDTYYLIDNNSTNHTYINNSRIPSQQLVKLDDYALIRLSNEEFEFHNE